MHVIRQEGTSQLSAISYRNNINTSKVTSQVSFDRQTQLNKKQNPQVTIFLRLCIKTLKLSWK